MNKAEWSKLPGYKWKNYFYSNVIAGIMGRIDPAFMQMDRIGNVTRLLGKAEVSWIPLMFIATKYSLLTNPEAIDKIRSHSDYEPRSVNEAMFAGCFDFPLFSWNSDNEYNGVAINQPFGMDQIYSFTFPDGVLRFKAYQKDSEISVREAITRNDSSKRKKAFKTVATYLPSDAFHMMFGIMQETPYKGGMEYIIERLIVQ